MSTASKFLGVLALGLFAAGCGSSRPVSVAAAAPPRAVGAEPIPGAVAEPLGTRNPYAGNPEAIQDGWRLFNWYNCSACHGGHGGGGMGPSLRAGSSHDGNRDAELFNSIADGRSRGMPAWGSRIPANQIWELVAYIQSMRTPLEADPPSVPADERVGAPSPEEPSGIPVTKIKE